MAIEEFTPYLISLIGESMRELLISDYIYGTGLSDSVKGITYQAIDGKYAKRRQKGLSQNNRGRHCVASR